MAFTGNEDCTTTLSNAKELNARFRENFPGKKIGIYFSQATLHDVLNQSDCVGIRFYFAQEEDKTFTLTFAGVTADENDILDIIGDSGIRCPDACSTPNDLNS